MGKIYLLNNENFEGTINLPMIEINFLKEEIDLGLYDSLIFTSKNAVRALNSIDTNWTKKEIYSIGQGTSQEIKKHHANLVFTSKDSYGDLFAEEIKDKLKDKKVLFLRAAKVISNLNVILKENDIDLDEKIIYETVCHKYEIIKKPPLNAVIIFTSPSTVKCFFKNFNWDDSYKAVAIGNITASAIPANIDILVAHEQTIQSCVDLAKSI
ncbi:MAG: uroporphyrinogen-III synthase [Sulfurospirillaceae bacterium]|nr:uroporphyrinogen-III synthase [Sulfurospirillaceae bacterium]